MRHTFLPFVYLVVGGHLLFALAIQAAFSGANLTVESVAPARHMVGALAHSPIVVTFDRAVDPASVSPQSFWAFARWSGTVSGVRSLSPDGLTMTLTPDRPLSAGESVMVILSHDLMAEDGSFLRSGGYSWQYWVRALPTGTLTYDLSDNLLTGNPSRPYGAVGSDMNGDGFLDLTTINEDTDDVRVFLNTADGSGTFGDFSAFPSTGSTPSPNEPGDFDRDGNVDLALANTQSPSVSILLGGGDGTFLAPQVVVVSSAPRGLAVLDIDGDGDLDIASADRVASQISLLRNDGAGVFGNITSFGSGDGGEWGLAAADMNDDGILDLVAGSGTGSGSTVWVYSGNGDGTFALLDSRDIGASTWMLVLGDVDGDGDEDISVASSSSVGVIVENGGDGSLVGHTTYAIDTFGLATDFADLDGDGDLDWITASFSGDWFLFLNDGTGTFIFDREFDAPAAASCSVALDIDGDGDLDLALVDEIANEVIVLTNRGVLFQDGFELGSVAAWSTSVP
jgi:hypothetical protein